MKLLFHNRLLALIFTISWTCLINAEPITVRIKHSCGDESDDNRDICETTKSYHFVMFFKANFFKAHQYCQINNLELLTIDSKEEEVTFLNLLNSKDFEYKSAKDFWTSGTDLGNEGKFFFLSNGKSIDSLTWAHDEPNNARRADSNETENCIAYSMTVDLKFYRLFDRFCSMKFYFVCQEAQRRRFK